MQQVHHALPQRISDQKITLRISKPMMAVADIGRFILGPGKRGGGDELHVSLSSGRVAAACCAVRMASILSSLPDRRCQARQ